MFLSRCIKERIGFKDGKPLAACVMYRCLLHWHAFESERTAIFDHIIEGIDEVLKVILPVLIGKHLIYCTIVLLYCSCYYCILDFTTYDCNCLRVEMTTLLCLIGCPIQQHFSGCCKEIYGQMVSLMYCLNVLHVLLGLLD